MRISDWSSDVCSSDLDDADRQQPVMKEAAAEVGAIGAAQYVADRLDEAANGPQGDERAEPQENPRSRRHHLADRPRQRPRDRRRHDRENRVDRRLSRSEEHKSELQSRMRISDADSCLKKTKKTK